jgi:hypothetical protein
MIGKIHVLPASQREITNGVIDNGYTVDSSNESTSIAANSFVQIVDSQNKKVIIATDQIDGVTLDNISTTSAGRLIVQRQVT